jgi:hypothetical protein
VGAVEAEVWHRWRDLREQLERYLPSLAHWQAGSGLVLPETLPPRGQDYHSEFGLPRIHETVIQAGVMVLSREHHRTVLLKTYQQYEDKGTMEWSYEMRPLSHELQESQVIHWLDPRFNTPWNHFRGNDYLFMNPKYPSRLLESFGDNREKVRGLMVHLGIQVLLRQCFFLHFAGTSFFDLQYYDELDSMAP